MNHINQRLKDIYEAWRKGVAFSEADADMLSAPFLMQTTQEYESSSLRVVAYGQETNGYEWYRGMRHSPSYDFDDVVTMQNFVDRDQSVDALMWAHSAGAQRLMRSAAPFWRALMEINGWQGVSCLWGNLCRADYNPGDFSGGSHSVLDHSLLAGSLAEQEGDLLIEEASALAPDACIFFTGPRYDDALNDRLPGCGMETVEDFPREQLVRIHHNQLPEETYRTYHPAYLNRDVAERWRPVMEYLKERVTIHGGRRAG